MPHDHLMRKKGYVHRKAIKSLWGFVQVWKCKYCSFTQEKFVK